MRKFYTASFAAGLILSFGTAALAQSPAPSANILAGGQNFDLSSAITDTGPGFTLPSTSLALAGGSLVTISFEGDKDPSISYSISFTNPTPNPVSYNFDLTIPVIATVANSPTRASLFGSMTDGGDNGSVSLSRTDYSALQRAIGVDTGGIDHDLGLDVGPDVTTNGAPGSAFNYGPFVKTGTSSFIITMLDVHLHFTLSGNGDSASFNGFVSVVGAPAGSSVPEPGSLAMLGAIGVCASGLTFRRRRSRR